MLVELVNTLHEACKRTDSWIRVCLIGNSGSGKTACVRKLASETGRTYVRVLVVSQHPDSVCGVRAYWQARAGEPAGLVLPDWFATAQREPCLVHLDEIDKCVGDPARCAVVLDILERGALAGGGNLHKDTWIVCSGQPVERELWESSPAGVALQTRLCFVEQNDEKSIKHLDAKWGIRTREVLAYVGKIELPYQPSYRAIDAVCTCADLRGEWDNVIDTIAKGCLGDDAAIELRNQWLLRNQTQPVDIWKMSVPEVLTQISSPDNTVALQRIFCGCDANAEDCWLALERASGGIDSFKLSPKLVSALKERAIGHTVNPLRIAAKEEQPPCAEGSSGMAMRTGACWIVWAGTHEPVILVRDTAVEILENLGE